MKSLKPYDPTEESEIVAIASGMPQRAWLVKYEEYTSPALIWATSQRQAAAIASKQKCDCCDQVATITSIRPEYHAQNMRPRPQDYTEFVARGGLA